MRILFLSDWAYPCDHRFLENVYAKKVANDGHEVVWTMRSDGERSNVREEYWHGCPVYVLPDDDYSPVRTVGKSLFGRLDSHLVLSSIADGRFDIVHVRNDLAMGVAATAVADRYDVPFCHQISHLKAEGLIRLAGRGHAGRLDAVKGVLGKRLRRRVASNADLILPISEAMETYLRERGYDGDMVPLLTGADVSVDPADIPEEPAREEFAFPDGGLLLYMGTMTPIRELEFLFDVLSEVRKRRDTHLLMAGGRRMENRARLKEAARARGVSESVTFTGWIEDDQLLYSAIRAADVGLSPLPPNEILRTNAPIKTLEYLTLKTPVVSSATPDQRTVLERSGGGYAVEYSVDAFADAVLGLLEDDAKRRRMGEAGRTYIRENRSFDVLAEQVLDIYERVVDEY